MSFYEDPIVDKNSKRSEESVNAVKSWFTRKNGFISREEYPDYGVDLDVEIILNDTGASSKKFAIQIKSTTSVSTTIHDNKNSITLEFKTSRLGYLARREPAYGLIILYDESDNLCYFDYVEDIIKRLDESDRRTGWRDQKTVTILLPFQIITSKELKHIHQKFATRYENSHLLIKEHGLKYNIPLLNLNEERPTILPDFNDPYQVASFLEKHGGFLFSEHEYRLILQLFGRITKDQVLSSVNLVFLSAITYTHSGNVIEAEYYLRRATKMLGQMTDEEKAIIKFSKVRIEFLKGNIDYQSFFLKFKELADNIHDEENQLIIEINLLFFETAISVNMEKIDLGVISKIERLARRIDNTNISEEKKHLFKVYHSETQHTFAIQAFINFYNKYKIKESLNIEIPIYERAEQAKLTISLTNLAADAAGKAYEFSKAKNLPLLKATAAHQLSKNFLSLRLALLLIPVEDRLAQDDTQVNEQYGRYHNLSLIAYNQFLEMHMFENAHEALSSAYDLQRLCMNLTNHSIGTVPQEGILKVIREIEGTYDLQPFDSQVDFLSEVHLGRKKNYKEILIGATTETLRQLAKGVLDGYELPLDRLPNIEHDLTMLKIFYEHCKDANIEALQHLGHIKNYDTHYSSLPIYILKHKILNIETGPSSDMKELLNELSIMIDLKG